MIRVAAQVDRHAVLDRYEHAACVGAVERTNAFDNTQGGVIGRGRQFKCSLPSASSRASCERIIVTKNRAATQRKVDNAMRSNVLLPDSDRADGTGHFIKISMAFANSEENSQVIDFVRAFC
jgi:hypothetical protein